jgi:hydrogenase maturation protease
LKRTVVIGIGNRFRGDDAIGLVAAEKLTVLLPNAAIRQSNGEALSLMELWDGADRAILIDAAENQGSAGRVSRLDATEFHTSTHAFSVPEAIEMARSLDRLPPEVIVFAIEGNRFGHGEELSEEGVRGLDEAIGRIKKEVLEP